MNNEQESSTSRARSEGSESRAIADASLRVLIGCAETLPSQSSCSDEEEWIHLQSESLVHWAERERRFIDAEEFRLLTASLKHLGGGLEHNVFFFQATGCVLKITKPPYFGNPMELGKYALNALWSNLLFEDSITFQGFLQGPEGISVVVSQPYVLGKSPTDGQIRKWFRDQNFEKSGFIEARVIG